MALWLLWYDQSGNGGNLSTPTASNQPQIVSSGTSLGYIQLLYNTQLDSNTQYIKDTNYSTFFVGKNTARMVWGSASAGYYAVASTASTGSAQFIEGNRYSNGSIIGPNWLDMFNALLSFAQITALIQRTTNNVNIRVGFGGYNNGIYKEFIVYPNQTISRTGVEDNIITHYGF